MLCNAMIPDVDHHDKRSTSSTNLRTAFLLSTCLSGTLAGSISGSTVFPWFGCMNTYAHTRRGLHCETPRIKTLTSRSRRHSFSFRRNNWKPNIWHVRTIRKLNCPRTDLPGSTQGDWMAPYTPVSRGCASRRRTADMVASSLLAL